MKKLPAAVLVLLAAMAVPAQADVKAKFDKSCTFCHSTGVALAPKVGDKAAWAPRLALGMDKLLLSVKNGKNAMPPKGMCNDCTDADYKALIQYMANGK